MKIIAVLVLLTSCSGCYATYRFSCESERLTIGSAHVNGSIAGINRCAPKKAEVKKGTRN